MDDHTPHHVRGIGSGDIGRFADSLAESLNRQMRIAFEPEERKYLRRFSSTEVAEILRVSTSNLRNRHKDGSFPEVHTDNRGHRFYTAQEVDALRDILGRTGKNSDSYKPGRRDGDNLQVLSVVNFKGGSSKTTATIHLAQRYALRGYRVLVLDMDPQASLTTFFGFRPELEFADGGTIYDALRYDNQQPLSSVIQKTYFHNLDMVPAGLMLSEYETETANALAARVQPIFAERLALTLERVQSDYDLVLIDCPPQLGFITLTALAASTGLLVTVVPGMLDIASMSQFLKLASETVKAVEEATSRTVSWDFVKFLITRYEPSDGPQTQMAGYLRSILVNQVMTEPMLKSTAISDAGMTQQTLYEVDPSQLIRKTLDRAMTSMNAVADELEQTIQMAWGRR
ncbi:chromosome partitioning protein ParA [Puniceibacterium antarcticum]|uniref:Chromosome partitioning protein ParA n=1 Tax=Puniceibacterium antarcticum TaxID=1206336 RepID=A0A2G8RKU2_9RHOB|nr:plasmid partitioning protein RepA [Puniceibacterium antarcticum]PIL22206.1 chromosome partitioning protein ParA [Puniceibacterium antarcticum]